ncbi:MAG: DUF2061 domain-containing protein [Candidatus Nanoarchaeia archaeon]|nr:DUF2061 domain-containing protein [Candidatus Nanoarchaeia archaeon]
MASTLFRSFVKGCSWELISFIITFIVVYAIYGNLQSALGLSLALTILKTFLFFLHERIWKKISWGKYYDTSFYKNARKKGKK